jgi:ribosomal protein L37AE/L43A
MTKEIEINLYNTPNFDVAVTEAIKAATKIAEDMSYDDDGQCFRVKLLVQSGDCMKEPRHMRWCKCGNELALHRADAGILICPKCEREQNEPSIYDHEERIKELEYRLDALSREVGRM